MQYIIYWDLVAFTLFNRGYICVISRENVEALKTRKMQGKGDGTGILRFAVNSKASDGFFCFSFVKGERLQHKLLTKHDLEVVYANRLDMLFNAQPSFVYLISLLETEPLHKSRLTSFVPQVDARKDDPPDENYERLENNSNRPDDLKQYQSSQENSGFQFNSTTTPVNPNVLAKRSKRKRASAGSDEDEDNLPESKRLKHSIGVVEDVEQATMHNKSPSKWTTEEVVQWVKGIEPWDKLGLPQVPDSFMQEDVNGGVLLELTLEELQKMGLTKLGPLKRFMDRIKNLICPKVPDSFMQEDVNGGALLELTLKELQDWGLLNLDMGPLKRFMDHLKNLKQLHRILNPIK